MTRAGIAGPPFWALPAGEALARLTADGGGLSQPAAAERLSRYGPNEIEEERRTRALELLLHQFRSPLIYILLLAALVTVVLREFIDAAVIGAVLVLNVALGSQEFKAERSMAALRSLARARTRVLRDGRERELDARELVPGDIVLVEAGAKVPADSRILHAVALEADESLLTGESLTVAKSSEPVAPDAVLGDRTSMLYTGTVVNRGHCRALVVATSSHILVTSPRPFRPRSTPRRDPTDRGRHHRVPPGGGGRDR
jgi:magnesium-transporting ATPase (P-type)